MVNTKNILGFASAATLAAVLGCTSTPGPVVPDKPEVQEVKEEEPVMQLVTPLPELVTDVFLKAKRDSYTTDNPEYSTEPMAFGNGELGYVVDLQKGNVNPQAMSTYDMMIYIVVPTSPGNDLVFGMADVEPFGSPNQMFYRPYDAYPKPGEQDPATLEKVTELGESMYDKVGRMSHMDLVGEVNEAARAKLGQEITADYHKIADLLRRKPDQKPQMTPLEETVK